MNLVFKSLLIGLISCLHGLVTYSQGGCTDPQALNFDGTAIFNDGTCMYPSTNYNLQLISNLSSQLNETSGLTFLNNKLYSHNDSGSSSEIFELDTNGSIDRTIVIENSTNIDWEAICQSHSEIFIGDFGNNSGNRTNLTIYRFPKVLINQDTISPISFNFTYSDQTDFTNTNNQHNFDCESFIFFNDSLHLFTKGWQNLYTKHYVLPISNNDTVIASLRDSMYVDGLITDASIDSSTGRLFLLGYKNNGSNFYTNFIYLLFDYPATDFFKGNKRRIEVGNVLNLGQTEGITLTNNSSGYISSEKVISSFINIEPKLFKFNFSSFFENPITNLTERSDEEISIFPNPTKDILTIKTLKNLPQGYYQIMDFSGRNIDSTAPLNDDHINVSNLQNGFYYLELRFNSQNYFIPFIKE